VLQEGQPLERWISNISCGVPYYEERRPFDPVPGEHYDKSPGTGSPEQRLREQEKDGVDAEVLSIIVGATGRSPECIGKFPDRTVGDLTKNEHISSEARRKILWDNPVRLYGLEV
jgi:hypothetical protein